MARPLIVPISAVSTVLLAFAACPSADPSPLLPARGLPLTFEKNTGRYDQRVRFVARTGNATVFLTQTEAVMVLRGKPRAESRELRGRAPRVRLEGGAPSTPSSPGPDASPRLRGEGTDEGRHSVLRMKLVGGNPKPVATGIEKQAGVVNYLIGNDPRKWRTRVPTYAKVRLAGVYPGVDVVYYGVRGERGEASGATPANHRSPLTTHLEYDFIVRPGADPRRIRLAFEGSDSVRVADGDLILTTSAGDVRMKRPYAYQSINGRRVRIACSYRLSGRQAAFQLARYDATKPLIVDPVIVLAYASFLGGNDDDVANGIVTDASGAAYVVGTTESDDFPTTPGSFRPSFGSMQEAFVTKWSPAGDALIYSTYLGGNLAQEGLGIALDASGAVYVTGYTWSNDFPTTVGAYNTAYNGGQDVFVTKLDPSGASLAYSTFIGGSSYETGYAIATDADGAAYVTGMARSTGFPTTAGAYDTSHNGNEDVFVTKLNAAGSALVYSTFIGTSMYEAGNAIAVDSVGSAYITGSTGLNSFPTTAGAFDTTFNGGRDAFVTKLNATGSALAYSTFLGGYSDDMGRGICVDGSGSAYVTGYSQSGDFPTTQGAFSTANAGASDVFVTKLNAAGSALVYSTYMGGFDFEEGSAIAVDAAGAAYIAGYTASFSFPTTADAFSQAVGGSYDGFVVKLNPSGSAQEYSTYLGAAGADFLYGISVIAPGSVFVAGRTQSTGYPATSGAFDTTYSGGIDGVVARLDWIEPSATTLNVSDRAGTITEAVVLRAYLRRVSDNAWLDGKTVQFSIAGTPVGSAVTGATGTSGRADLSWVISEGSATRTIGAEFAGDAAYNPSSGTATLTCQSWGTKMVAFDRTARITDRTELKCRLLRSDNAPLYGKGISFYIDGTFIITRNTNVDGYASYPNYDVPDGAGAGARTILSEWPGNGGYAGISKTATLTVLKAIPYIWVLSKSVPQGGIANLYAYFRRLYDYQKQTGKTVDLKIDGTVIQTVITDDVGVARYLYRTVETPGVHTIRCEFYGDAIVEPGYGEGNLTIY